MKEQSNSTEQQCNKRVIHWRLTTYPQLKYGLNNYFLDEGDFSLIFLVYMKYIIHLCCNKFN